MAEYRYDPAEIEPRWQQVWADEGTWEVSNDADDPRPSSYVLEMLPYPSGEPHIGHLKTYSVGDAVAHFHRRTGRRVLHPMGYDAFGLPAENHAIRTGQHPRDSTDKAIARTEIEALVAEHFDLRPGAFREYLDLHRPIYQKTAAYGHFGREDPDFTWERTDKAAALREAAGLGAASTAV